MTSDQQTSWVQLSVDVAREYSEPIAHLFAKHGDGRVYVGEVGDWDADDSPIPELATDTVTVTGYLANDHTVEHRKGMISIGLGLIGKFTDISEVRERIVNSEEWLHQTFPVTRVGSLLVIVPTDMSDTAAKLRLGEVRISLAPGLAFGTGAHPTTRMCLEQLEIEAADGALIGAEVLDVGCGSGILTIAALKLGASTACCVDTDETSVRATHMNLKSSGVEDRARVIHGSLPNAEIGDRRFPLVLANITSRVLEDMAPQLCARTATDGVLIISGVLDVQAEQTLAAFQACGMTVTQSRTESDWRMYKLTRVTSE